MNAALLIVVIITIYGIYLAHLGSRAEKPRLLDPDVWHRDPVEHRRLYLLALNDYRRKFGREPLPSLARKSWQFWRRPDDETLWGSPHGRAERQARAS